MTKRTNALILRLGYSMLWMNKKYTLQTGLLLQLNYLICWKLKKKKYNVLKIFYNLNTLKIYIYKLSFSKYQLKLKKQSKSFILFLLILLCKTNNFLSFFLMCKFFFNILKKSYFVSNFLLKNYYQLNLLSPFKFSFIKIFYKIKFKNILSKLKLKQLAFYIELEVRFKLNLYYSILLNTIFSLKGIFLKIKRIKCFYKEFFKKKKLFHLSRNNIVLFYVIFLVSTYNLINILGKYIATMLRTAGKDQRKYLYNFISYLKACINSREITNRRFRFLLRGKINGFLKRSQFKYTIGALKLYKKTLKVSYTLLPLFTRYGTISIKIWMV